MVLEKTKIHYYKPVKTAISSQQLESELESNQMVDFKINHYLMSY